MVRCPARLWGWAALALLVGPGLSCTHRDAPVAASDAEPHRAADGSLPADSPAAKAAAAAADPFAAARSFAGAPPGSSSTATGAARPSGARVAGAGQTTSGAATAPLPDPGRTPAASVLPPASAASAGASTLTAYLSPLPAHGLRLLPVSARAPEIPERFPPTHEGTVRSRVTRVVDGDTVVLDGIGKARLISMNTPERGEPLYQEATDLTKALVLGRAVEVEYEKNRQDRYHRALVYLFVGGRLVNAELVRAGLAYTYFFHENERYDEELVEMQQAARADRVGLWSLDPPPRSRPGYGEGYVAGRREVRFHRPGCRRLGRGKKTSYSTREEAFDSGRSPCTVCNP